MSLTIDQLCAKARYRDKENVWFQWIAGAACLDGSADDARFGGHSPRGGPQDAGG